MIDPFYYALGFVFYITFTLMVFRVYSQNQERKNFIMLAAIYLYNTLLMAYVINFVDYTSPFFERIMQAIIYFLVGIAFLFYKFFSDLKYKDDYDSQL